MFERQEPSYWGAHVVGAVLFLGGAAGTAAALFGIAQAVSAGGFALLAIYPAVGLLAAGLALCGIAQVIDLLTSLAQSAWRRERELSELVLQQKARFCGTDAASLQDLANTR